MQFTWLPMERRSAIQMWDEVLQLENTPAKPMLRPTFCCLLMTSFWPAVDMCISFAVLGINIAMQFYLLVDN